MPDFADPHPSPEDLVDYAEGKMTDVQAFESHLDICRDCAQAVLKCRSLQDQQLLGLIRPLTSQERALEKDRLRQILSLKEPGKTSGTMEFLASLAGLGGAFELPHAAQGPKPMLAEHETASGGPDEDSTEVQNSEKSSPPDVTDPGNPASAQGSASTDQTDEIAEVLARLDEILNSSEPDPRAESEGMEPGIRTGEYEEISANPRNEASPSDESGGFDVTDDAEIASDEPDDGDSSDDDFSNLDI